MDAHLIAIAQDCLNAAYDKTMAFPDIVGTLIKSGFEGYVVDYRCNTTTYFLPSGDNVVLDNRPSEGWLTHNLTNLGLSLRSSGRRPILQNILTRLSVRT